MKWCFWLIVCVALAGCTLIPSNTSRSANAATAGNMKTEQEMTARALFTETRKVMEARTNVNGAVSLQVKSMTESTDAERFNTSYTRSLPFLLTVGIGGLACVAAGFFALHLHRQLKVQSRAYSAVTSLADNGLASVTGLIGHACATEKDPRVTTILKSIGGELEKVRGKVNSV